MFQKTGMLLILGEQCFDFRPQLGIASASFIEKRCPSTRLELTRSAKNVGDFLVSFRRHRSVLRPLGPGDENPDYTGCLSNRPNSRTSGNPAEHVKRESEARPSASALVVFAATARNRGGTLPGGRVSERGSCNGRCYPLGTASPGTAQEQWHTRRPAGTPAATGSVGASIDVQLDG